MKDALDTTREITKLIKKSPRRDACFANLKAEMAPDTPGIRVLCPTRWTVRAEALQSILENYQVLLELWIESVDMIYRWYGEDFTVLGHAEPPRELIILLYCIIKFNTASIVK